MVESRTRWTELEWYEVVRETMAVRQKQTGIGWGTAAAIAQKRVLAKSRRRPEPSLHGGARAVLEAMAERIAAGWVPEGGTPPETPPVGHEARKAARAPSPVITPVVHPRTAAKLADDAIEATFTAPGMVRWKDHEWTLIAGAVRYRQMMGDARALARIVWEAQQDVLPRDRLRKRAPLYAATDLQSQYAKGETRLASLSAREKAMCEGRLAEWEAAQAKAREGLATLQAAAPAAVPVPAPAPEPPTLSTPEPATHAAPAPMLQFPAAAPDDPLAARVAMILGHAAAQISAVTRQHVIAEYDRQLDRLTIALASTLRQYVHTLVESELGPLSTSTAAAPPPPPAPAAPEPDAVPDDAPTGKGTRVDVVGLSASNLQSTRERAAALGIDARFVDQDRLTTWNPRERVIVATRLSNHGSVYKARAAGAEIFYATGGTQSVIAMLESLATGQPVNAIEPAQAAAPGEESHLPGEQPARRVLVQIVGQPGPGRGMIRETARALNMDTEFIDPERALRQWLPAKNVIMAVKDGRLRKAAQEAGAQVYFATAGTASITGMLESIAQHGGALQ